MTPDTIRAKVAAHVFGPRLITNMHRGAVAECIVHEALQGSGWTWTGGWNVVDMQHRSGAGLEVKQAAIEQTWSCERGLTKRIGFDIAVRPGHYVGHGGYIPNPDRIRQAQIYVFALHTVHGADADHADPDQWLFYVVRGDRLPADQKSIALSRVRRLAAPEPLFGGAATACAWTGLAAMVGALMEGIG